MSALPMSTRATITLLALIGVAAECGCGGRSQPRAEGGTEETVAADRSPAIGQQQRLNDLRNQAVAAHYVRLLLRHEPRDDSRRREFLHRDLPPDLRRGGHFSAPRDQRFETMVARIRDNPLAVDPILVALRREPDDSDVDDVRGKAWGLLAYVGSGSKRALPQLLAELGAKESAAPDELAVLELLAEYGDPRLAPDDFDDESDRDFYVPVVLALGQLGGEVGRRRSGAV